MALRHMQCKQFIQFSKLNQWESCGESFYHHLHVQCTYTIRVTKLISRTRHPICSFIVLMFDTIQPNQEEITGKYLQIKWYKSMKLKYGFNKSEEFNEINHWICFIEETYLSPRHFICPFLMIRWFFKQYTQRTITL